mmetsp:Transcript_9776/g.24350  ORF Transcript_9776/g.24350 Transcript_9776/m.24350 type:complete len:80 (+) Transcript_9776:653-892(+)
MDAFVFPLVYAPKKSHPKLVSRPISDGRSDKELFSKESHIKLVSKPISDGIFDKAFSAEKIDREQNIDSEMGYLVLILI